MEPIKFIAEFEMELSFWSDVCVVRYEWLLGRDGEARKDYSGKKKEEIDYRSFSDNTQLCEFLVFLANRPADLFSCSLTGVKNW